MGRFHRLGETDRAPVRIEIDGASVLALAGDTLQVAILTHAGSLRRNEFDGGPRAGFCLMAACQDCLVWTVTGEQLRGCSTEVEQGMRIVTRGPAWQIEP